MERKFTHWLSKISLILLLCCQYITGTAEGYAFSNDYGPVSEKLVGDNFTPSAEYTVTGKVISAEGEALPGVTVVVKGTTVGTITDINGLYTINVNAGSETLVFSYVGYKTQEVAIENRTEINIIMIVDIQQLQEIVVIGYGTQEKRDVTGAISSVSAKDIEERQPVDVFEALQAQAAGIQINTDPRPGGEPSIRIRGTSTLEGGVEPLYVVDGVPMDNINVINPNDIQSMEVLKDAASAAIYGSRSANGVIIITTKQGLEGKPKINVRYNTMLSTLSHKLPQATADDRRLYDRKRRRLNDLPSLNADSLNPAYNADNDLQEMLTRAARRHQVDFSVSGASDKLNYYTSFGYLDDEGIILNSWAKLARARINIEYKASERFTFGNRVNFSYGKKNFINEGRVLLQAMQRPATFQVYYPDGTYAPTLGGRRNPLAFATEQVNEYQNYDANIYSYLTFKITNDLKLTTDFNIRGEFEEHLDFTPRIIEGTNGGYENRFNTYWMQQNYLNYDKAFGDHTINAVLGMSAEKWINRHMQIEGDNYVSESVLTTNAIQDKDLTEIFNEESRHTLAGFFSRIGYSYKGKYILNGTVRRDGSSRFGKENRWGTFPSASAGWRFSDEAFMAWSRGVLDDGKLRASYGETGNERIGNYDALELYTFGDNYYNGILGVVPSNTLGNPQLSWETTKQIDIGIDLSFLNHKISFTADYYKKTTEDLLYDAPLPAEIGYEETKVNVGTIENEGFEFVINTYPVRNNQITWNASYFMGFNENRAVKLYNGVPLTPSGRWLIEEGGRLGDFYGYKSLGVYPYDESNAYSADWELLVPVFSEEVFTGEYLLNGKTYNGDINQMKNSKGHTLGGGDMIWFDANSDGIIDDKDKVVLGNAQPKFTAGLYNQVSYKEFTLSFNIYVQWGNKIYDKGRWGAGRFNGSNPTPDKELIHAAWENPGDVTWVPKVPDASNRNNMPELNSLFVEDASFIRLRNVRLTYNLNPTITEKLKLNGLSVYAYGNNLLTWTNYFWYDPEIPLGSPLRMGEDNGRSPRSRQVGLGINVNF